MRIEITDIPRNLEKIIIDVKEKADIQYEYKAPITEEKVEHIEKYDNFDDRPKKKIPDEMTDGF